MGSFIINDEKTSLKDNSEDIYTINTISIDEYVYENKIKKVDFIKMDIEGAELEALKGAKSTISDHRPQLAVAIYHVGYNNSSDLYEIPLYLSNNLENYTFRLGHYSTEIYETVLYAIPNELYTLPAKE